MAFLAVSRHFPQTKGGVSFLSECFGGNSLALLLTTVIQTAWKQLTVFNAICVTHLLTFLA